MERVDAGGREEPEGTGQGSRPGDNAAKAQGDMFGAAFFAAIVPMTISSLLDGRLIEINAAACEMLGVERATSIGTLAENAGFFVDLADRDAVVREVQDKRVVRDREFPFRRKDGKLAYGSIQATVIDVDGEPCILAEMSDITSRRSTEEALRASEARFATAFNSAGVMMLIVRALDGTIVSGDYVLDGGFRGSVRGTFVGDRLSIDRIDSERGFDAKFYGRVTSGAARRIGGTWEATLIAPATGPTAGSWSAQPAREDEGEPR